MAKPIFVVLLLVIIVAGTLDPPIDPPIGRPADVQTREQIMAERRATPRYKECIRYFSAQSAGAADPHDPVESCEIIETVDQDTRERMRSLFPR